MRGVVLETARTEGEAAVNQLRGVSGFVWRFSFVQLLNARGYDMIDIAGAVVLQLRFGALEVSVRK